MKKLILIAGLLATSSLTVYADRLPICRSSMNTTECIQTSPTDGRFCDRWENTNLRLPEVTCGGSTKDHPVKSAPTPEPKLSTKGGGGKGPGTGGEDPGCTTNCGGNDDGGDDDNGGGNDDEGGCKGKGGGNCGIGKGGGGGNGTSNEGKGKGPKGKDKKGDE